MNEFIFYLLKVIACSGILLLFYWIALRNKLFHQWNRFYLLAAVLIALVVPFVQLTVHDTAETDSNKAIQMLNVVYDAGNYMEEITIAGQAPSAGQSWMLVLYLGVSSVLFLFLIISIARIHSIIRNHVVTRVGKVNFIDTNVKGTPFSFFNFIFWNAEIDLQSETGQKIFQHELVHVKEKHTIDKIVVQVILVFFWINPFFWLIRRELKFIHEFIADRRSVAEHGAVAFAAMILQSTYPKQFNSITNQFFQTSIKRRIAMLTKNQHPGWNYFTRIAAFVVVITTVAAFTIKPKKIERFENNDREYVVVIDAGHGVRPEGNRSGALVENIYEDDIVLAIAQKIKQQNNNKNIRIILTRNSDQDVKLEKRVEIAKEQKADLFISLHLNADVNDKAKNGVEVIIPNKNPGVLEGSKLLGSAILSELGSIFLVKQQLVTRTVGIYVLNFNNCPAVLVECGYITNEKDRKFLTDPANQKSIADKILRGIEHYLNESPAGLSQNIDQEQNLNIDNKVEITSYDFEIQKGNHLNHKEKPLVFINGQKFNIEGIESIKFTGSKATIYEKNDPDAIKKFGPGAKNGVIVFEDASFSK